MILQPDAGAPRYKALQTALLDYFSRQTSLQLDVATRPLKRLHLELPGKKNSCSTGVVQSPDVLDSYQWVLPLVRTTFTHYATSPEGPLANTGRAGAVLGSAMENVARKFGLNVHTAATMEQLVRMVEAGRLDSLVSVPELVAEYHRSSSVQLYPRSVLLEVDAWVVCSLTTDDHLVEALQRAWQAGLESGEVDKMFEPYGFTPFRP